MRLLKPWNWRSIFRPEDFGCSIGTIPSDGLRSRDNVSLYVNIRYTKRLGGFMIWFFLSCTNTATKSLESVRITWLGVTSFVVEYDDKTILLDAFFSRPKLGEEEGSSEQGRQDFLQTMSTLGIDSLDAILIGHAHYDHAIDVGMVSLETDAPIYASSTTCWIAKAQGVE